MTVDEFVASKVLPEFPPVVAAIRKVVKESAPGVIEVMSYAIPMFGLKRPVAWINPSKMGITFGFRQGASFADRHGLLRGKWKACEASEHEERGPGQCRRPELLLSNRL